MDLNEIKQDIRKKIWQYSVPAIVSMVLTAFITVADGFFMGNFVGKEGIAAVNRAPDRLSVSGDRPDYLHRRRVDRRDGPWRRG